MRRRWWWPVLVAGLAVAAVACEGAGGAARDDASTGGGPDVATGSDAVTESDVGAAVDVAPDCGDALPDVGAAPPPDAADGASDVTPDAGDPLPPRPTGPYVVPIGDLEDPTFAVGPYLGETTTTSVVVSWETTEPGDSVVEFGPDATYGGRVEGAAGTMHEVRVTGLAPETLYRYRACTAGVCTGDLGFATAPLPGRPLRFAVYADTQDHPDMHRRVAENIAADAPAFVLHGGDTVGNGADRPSYKTEMFDPARRYLHYVPVFSAVGNHDWKDLVGKAGIFREYFAFPVDPDVPTPELAYTFTYGDAFVLVMDDTAIGADLFVPLGAPQEPALWRWLLARTASPEAQAARWRFAIFHYPPASACQEDWFNMRALREHVLPLLHEQGFQAVFSGHTHEYEHFVYDGLHSFVTGGGGGGVDPDEACQRVLPELQLRRSVNHHLTVDLAADQAVVRAVSVDGEVFDTVVLTPTPAAGPTP